MAEMDNDLQHIVKHNDQYYYTEASRVNFPIPGLLGDMQIDLNMEQSVYPDWAVQCHIEGSKAVSSTAEPGYQRSLLMKTKKAASIESVNYFSLSVKSAIRGSASFIFRNVDQPSQVIENAMFSIKIDYVYGCTGCVENPFMITTPFDVITTGVMRFISNCTFYLNEFSCSSTPQ